MSTTWPTGVWKQRFSNLDAWHHIQMTRVSTNQILGNRGENLVSYLLSQYCLVRPVANGTDIGVDLFCETIIEDGRSAGHFWIQVKSKAKQTKKVKLDKGHVEYWIRHPVPVFIFIICTDQNTNASNYEIRSINLIEQLIKKIPTSKGSREYFTLMTPLLMRGSSNDS